MPTPLHRSKFYHNNFYILLLIYYAPCVLLCDFVTLFDSNLLPSQTPTIFFFCSKSFRVILLTFSKSLDHDDVQITEVQGIHNLLRIDCPTRRIV